METNGVEATTGAGTPAAREARTGAWALGTAGSAAGAASQASAAVTSTTATRRSAPAFRITAQE